MSSVHSEAEKKFWATPELVQQFLPYLDLNSTRVLAKIHQMTQNILHGKRDWEKLIQRNCPVVGLDQTKQFVEILKTLEGPEDHILVLLDAICESNLVIKPDQFAHFSAPKVQMGCPRHQEEGRHDVSLAGFDLLEQVEGAFGTTLQTVLAIEDTPAKSIGAGCNVPFYMSVSTFSAIGSRMSRQQKKLEFPHIIFPLLDIGDIEDAERFKEVMLQWKSTLLDLPPYRSPYGLYVKGNIGPEGWKLLAEGLQLHPELVTFIETSKEALDGVTKEDLRSIWDAMAQDGCFRISYFDVKKEDGDGAWERLENLVDMEEAAWKKVNEEERLRVIREEYGWEEEDEEVDEGDDAPEVAEGDGEGDEAPEVAEGVGEGDEGA